MIIPFATFDSVHLVSNGAMAPDGVVKVFLACMAGDGSAANLEVDVIEKATGESIAAGDVRCTGEDEPHDLPMTKDRPLAARAVILRYMCGTETKDDRPIVIFCVNQ
jgi:hypothetical protein